ncbi:MAG: hypothetical protein WD669_09095 [Pirellulales bacterium]
MITKRRFTRSGFAKLELLLVLAFLALLFQVFPSLWFGVLGVLDIRNWPRGVWVVINVAVVLALFAARFGPDLVEDWKQHSLRKQAASDRRKKEIKDLDLKEQRELFKRMQEARKRQVI